MTEIEKRIINNINNGILFDFLGAENVERLKTEITDAIIQQVIHDLHDSYDYIISPDDIAGDLVDEIIEESKKTIKPEVEKKLYEKTMEKLGLE